MCRLGLHHSRSRRTPLDVTISIGVAAAADGSDETTVESLMKRADEALYEAKRSGRNRVIGKSTARDAEPKTQRRSVAPTHCLTSGTWKDVAPSQQRVIAYAMRSASLMAADIVFAQNARYAFALLNACSARSAATPPQLPTCDAAQYRAFDFWIGDWDAFRRQTPTRLAGRSPRSAAEDSGCVITEHWTSARGPYTGQSINIYDRVTGQWNQFYSDSTGEVTRFAGNPENGSMRLVDPANVAAGTDGPRQTRMTFTPNADGTVRQHGETSTDGVTWTTDYDFIYRPRPE